jgi:putative spermidine/putrescine transport system ATP-binding protein
MSYVLLQDIKKIYHETPVLSGIDMEVNKGEFVTLLGPSGCGKSTILRILAGLTEATSGSVYIDGKDMRNVAPKNREIGMVFQSYALFPNMTVEDNVAFGLKMKKVPQSEVKERVDHILDVVHLTEKKAAYPNHLSGGQQQRVALARSLVVRPKVLLLDEPLSALDAQIRKRLQTDLRNIQREMEMTMLLVTHDQEEAMAVSDHIFVMKTGEIAQRGTPIDIYTRPRSEFIARFIGNYNIILREQLEKLIERHLEDDFGKYAIRPEAIHFSQTPSSYHIRAEAIDSTMHGNVIRTIFEAERIRFLCERLHHGTGTLQKGKIYDCFIEPEDVVGLK